jgi:hypothetical protein
MVIKRNGCAMQNKTLYAYDKTGKFVGEYPSIKEASKFLYAFNMTTDIKEVLDGKGKKLAGGFYFSYTSYFKLSDDMVRYINTPHFTLAEHHEVCFKKQPIYQYDVKGNLVNCYDSINAAAIAINNIDYTIKENKRANDILLYSVRKWIYTCIYGEPTKSGKPRKHKGYYFSDIKY